MSGPTGRSPLTEEQREPVALRGASVALAAGAGCGKTTVLTERFVALLEGEDRLPLSRIVALTFTEKAARELRDRVRSACRERMDRGDDPAYWREVVRGLESARIGTFHAFCADLLRLHATEARCDPGFEVLDETIAPAIREKSLDACLRDWLAGEDEDFRALAIDHGLNAVRYALAGQLGDRPLWDVQSWAARGADEVLRAWERFRDGRCLPEIVGAFAREQTPLVDFLRRNACSHPKMKERVARLLDGLPRVHLHEDPLAALDALRNDAMVKGAGTKAHWDSEEIYKEAGKRFEKVRKGIDDIRALFAPDGGRSLACAEASARFARLMLGAIRVYDEQKARAGVLDFHDLQAKTLDLLRHGPARVRREVSASIGAILVDEFQDTDATQSEILQRLAGEALAGGRLFLVGDAKQSIYGFRGAEPAIFGTFRGRFPETGRRNLTRNFRSLPRVLHFVNALFAETFEGEEHVLVPGGATHPDFDEHPRVEFLMANRRSGERDVVASRRKSEAEAIARLLAGRLDRGWIVRDRATGEPRRASQGDVAILFRSRSGFVPFEASLAAAGLDFHVVGGSTYFAQQEVIDLVNLLSAVEDPMDPLALAGLLRGPFFGVSDEGLFWLATHGKGDIVSAFDAWPASAQSLSEDDRASLDRAAETLRLWRSRKDRMPIGEWLERALDESGFEAALMGEFLGDRKRANVRKLVGMARAFDARGGLSLGDFVEKLRGDVTDSPREDQAATADEGGEAIRLMTIHQAKGLEFPIVILPDLDRRLPNETQLVTHHPELGFLLRATRPDDSDEEPRNLARELADALKKRAEAEESLRVFYVATTRARDSLILAPGIAAGEPASSPAVRLLSERFDLATGHCRADLPDGLAMPAVGVIDPNEFDAERPTRAAKFRPKILVASRAITRTAIETAPTEEPPRLPAFVSLVPEAGMSPTAALVDRVLRAAVSNPAAWGEEAGEDVIDRAARALGVMVPARVRAIASGRLAAWRDLPLRRRLANAAEVKAALPWRLAWPLDDPAATVFSGRIDMAFRDGNGESWTLVAMAPDDCAKTNRMLDLSLRLAAYAADPLGMSPVVEARLVVIAADAESTRIVAFGEDDVEAALTSLRAGFSTSL